MKLGKKAPKFSDSDIRFKSIMKPGIHIPDLYDWDVLHPGMPTPMFANDRYGCCVISGRSHQTLRFEALETGQVLNISDAEVEDEYFYESEGQDSGLVVSQSLDQWARRGWKAGGKIHRIKGYSRLDLYNRTQIKTAIFSDLGVGIGFNVTESCMKQFDLHEPWTVTAQEGGSLGGHYVYLYGYDVNGVICITWGRRQHMSWEFFDRYTDEVWAIFDAKTDIESIAAIDAEALRYHGADFFTE